MAETPLIACARAREMRVPAGARYTMTIVYKYAPQSAVRAWHERRGPVPFCWPAAQLLVDVTGRARSLVYDDLKALEKAGIIVPAQRTIHGQQQAGWELPLRDEETDMSSPPGGGQSSDSDIGQQRRFESDRPDTKAQGTSVSPSGPSDNPAASAGDKSGPPDKRVRPAGQDSPTGRTPPSGPPDKNSGFNSELNKNFNSIGDAVDNPVNRETRPRATPPAAATPSQALTSRPKARRPVTLIDGEPAGSGLTAARELLVELGQLFVPTDDTGRAIEAQRIRSSDPAALVLAERLLAVPLEGLDEDAARDARREQLRYVVETATAFASLCRKSKAKAAWWRANMLSQQVAAGKTLSPWAMIERDVAEAQRAAGASEAQARAAAQAIRVTQPRTAPDSPAEAAAREARAEHTRAQAAAVLANLGAAMRLGPAPARPARPVAEGGEERERNRGRWRESQAGRDEEGDLELRRQMNAALLRARQAKGDELTRVEADRIREQFAEGARA